MKKCWFIIWVKGHIERLYLLFKHLFIYFYFLYSNIYYVFLNAILKFTKNKNTKPDRTLNVGLINNNEKKENNIHIPKIFKIQEQSSTVKRRAFFPSQHSLGCLSEFYLFNFICFCLLFAFFRNIFRFKKWHHWNAFQFKCKKANRYVGTSPMTRIMHLIMVPKIISGTFFFLLSCFWAPYSVYRMSVNCS